jgi:hypothetical protein
MDKAERERQRLTKKGTIRLRSFEELDSVEDTFMEKGLVSPGGAAGMLNVSRAYIHQLEKNKRIRAYRIKEETLQRDTKGLPLIWRLLVLTQRRGDYIWIPVVDLEEYRNEIERKRKK